MITGLFKRSSHEKSLRMFSPVEVELDLLDLGEHIKCSGKVVWNIQRRGDDSPERLPTQTHAKKTGQLWRGAAASVWRAAERVGCDTGLGRAWALV